ncbi:putative ABC-type xenobiotic transporter [Helianthus annuus]|uniref:ABC-type xenobiotic transporter n=2 Tax=Helianthus annuus TaxID=4232 RepID=A0A251T2H7_HELAN|nr:putative ABC-type xenobiotic transporter [Helianthus annuus]KAJ0489660.1 putative ABC-type xenobiotic transporter [Helianthus annuus]KAJ0493581.1 putative ABC-type xenobiotic transporter [Helianthus annuus]KAJ0505572.1 putative ABC-type xenobiotic transporter [Helianthus annuus]KAJ0675240.1 putative ABC-type xenobiotic transporter [Helianthus annuus]
MCLYIYKPPLRLIFILPTHHLLKNRHVNLFPLQIHIQTHPILDIQYITNLQYPFNNFYFFALYSLLISYYLKDFGVLVVMEFASMAAITNICNVFFFLWLFIWGLADILKNKRRGDTETETEKARFFTTFEMITVISSFVITVCHMGFVAYKMLKHDEVVCYEDIIMTSAWCLATVVTVYSWANNKTYGQVAKWPIVLVLFWCFSVVVDLVVVGLIMLNYFESENTNVFGSVSNVIDMGTLPFLIVLGYNGVGYCVTKRHKEELDEPLLQESVAENTDAFTNAGIWKRVTFNWLNPLFETGRAQKLEFVHVPSIPESETADEAALLLEESIQKQKTRSSVLPKAILNAVRTSLAINAVFAGVNTLASYMGPILITSFVNYLSEDSSDSNYKKGLILSFIFFLAKTVESLSQRQWYFGAQRIGIRIRAALMVLIYKKSLSIKYGTTSNGKIINLINVDVEKISEFFWHIHGIWLLPVQVLLALIILYTNLGFFPSMAALVSTVLVIISNTPLANMQKDYQTKVMESKDSRIKATSEILKSMRVLKLHSWESNFKQKLIDLREKEQNWLKKYLYMCSAIAFLFWTSPTLVSVSTFSVCIFLRTPLTPGVVLSTLATFRILQDPIYNLPELVSMVSQTKVSLDRIKDFITDQDSKQLVESQPFNGSDIAIEVEPGEYLWDTNDSDQRQPTIKISEKMKIRKGYKVAICGSVGAGKSSLLCSILGEIPRVSGGRIKVFGSKAFVPQSAWIQTGTIRDNILFGKEMNKRFYDEVVDGCSLERDFETLADGDVSVVGERGLNLSGGQKQRIQLARALYSDSDVYVLDDPFSAVDAHTGAHMFKKCLLNLLDKKTVVYVTHQLEFLSASDLILVIKDGGIVQSGKYNDLIADPTNEFARQIAAHSKSLNQVNPTPDSKTLTQFPQSTDSSHLVTSLEPSRTKGGSSATVMPQEESQSGRVKFNVYSSFITSAYKGALVPVILICHSLFLALQMGSNYWMAWATEDAGRASSKVLVGVFVILSGGSSVFILGRAILLSTIAIETGQNLFLQMLNSVFHAPVSFFDTTPSSRILNRCSTDQSTVDVDVPYRLAGLVFAILQLLSIILLMSHVAWPIFILCMIIIAISIWYQAYYITTARELARMIGIQKSPIQHHFSESISGASTIRCFNQEIRFLSKCFRVIDDYSRVTFHNTATMEWLCVRINFLFNLVFFILLVVLVHLPRASIDPSLAGLAVTYGLSLNVLQAWVIWNLCNVENKMISVERILQFASIPSEAPAVIENHKPDPNWPTIGQIELKDLHVRYHPALPTVLRGITCTFPGQKKIGVVGRTGSGKSTLIQALFRVVEPTKGQILIDGLDISKIGLHDLRSKLGIIPQDPTLFQGTMRFNLDPLEQHSDHEIWEVLNKCRLADIVRQDKRLLDTPVAEDGENWSVGQRQLVCLARALLQKRKILVLDEATASIDTETDNVMQKTIREETSRCTVITIAHRIPTIVDSDLVLVLDQGKVAEYDSPTRLQSDGSSAFSKLVNEFLRRSL